MKDKLSTTVLLLALLGAVVYSLVSLHQDDLADTAKHQPSNRMAEYSSSSAIKNAEGTRLPERYRTSSAGGMSSRDTATKIDLSMPIKVKLIGTRLSDTPIVLLESKGIAHEYALGDLIFNWPIQVIDIEQDSVTLAFENRSFLIVLEGPNLLNTENDESELDFFAMSGEEIGTRPRIIEHIVHLKPTDFIADGMIAAIGMNPKLFSQAGLKEDDVIKTINGQRVTVADELAELQRTIPFTDTLVFEVERKGRMITLYLDIPSEALKIRR